jgi:formate dehydrogenase subunit gamma
MTTPPSLPDELPRHSGFARTLHGGLAACFILVMATGLTLYWSSILKWAEPYFGGKPSTVNLHFWGGLALTFFTLLLFFLWRRKARWTPTDTHFVRHLRDYAMRPDQSPPPETGFFNGGQKLYFWAVVASGAVLFGTGLVWWFRKDVPHPVYAVCRTTHRVVGVIMSFGLLVHIYKATIGEPGTLRSMLRGTVTREWARTRRPKWFRDLGGR